PAVRAPGRRGRVNEHVARALDRARRAARRRRERDPVPRLDESRSCTGSDFLCEGGNTARRIAKGGAGLWVPTPRGVTLGVPWTGDGAARHREYAAARGPDRPKMETTVRRALLVAGWTALLAAPAPAVTIEWVPIGNPGNAPVPTKCFVPD